MFYSTIRGFGHSAFVTEEMFDTFAETWMPIVEELYPGGSSVYDYVLFAGIQILEERQ